MARKRNDEEIREIVKKIRKEKNINQTQLAKMMHYSSPSRVSEFEKGKTKDVYAFVTEFCKALNIDEREILYCEDNNTSHEIIIKSNYIRYKVPNFKLSIIAGSIFFVALVFQIISSLIINEQLKLWNVSVSVLAIICGILFLIIQWSSSENYVDKYVTDRENVTYLYDDIFIKHPLASFILTQVLISLVLTLVLALLCVNYQDPVFIVFYVFIILLEIFNTFFGFNVFKKESTKSGFIIYIFELIILLVYLFISTIISVGLQTYEVNEISYLCLGFSEATLLSMILRMLNCNKFLKYRKISEKQKKQPKISE